MGHVSLDAERMHAASSRPKKPVQPVWVRLSHWLNVIAVVIMVMSGWRIYDASPVFAGFEIPTNLTLGGWLGGALQWHFAAMWLLVLNGVFYVVMSVSTKRALHRFFPLTLRAIVTDFFSALRGRLSHDDLSHYNAVQKFAYLFAIADIVVLVLSGLVIWKSVQFPLLRTLLGGYDFARVVHFSAMAALVAFVAVHVVMVILVPRSLLTMIRGR